MKVLGLTYQEEDQGLKYQEEVHGLTYQAEDQGLTYQEECHLFASVINAATNLTLSQNWTNM